MSLRKTLINAATISSINVIRLLFQFFAIPILARFLAPADYGIVGIAMPFILFAMMLADAGIGMSLVRTPSSDRIVWSTCFWLSVLLGGALAGLMIGVAPLAAYVYGEPRLTAIVMTLGLVVLAQAVSAIPGARLQQSQKFRVIAMTEIAAMAVGIGTAVTVALNGGGPWALVDQQLAFYTARLCLTCWTSRFRPLLVFDLNNVKEHLGFGRDVLAVNILGFVSRSIDNLVIGKVLSAAAVGVYSMAFQFARIPMMLVTGPLQFVLYGQLAAAHSNKTLIRSTFLVLTQLLSLAIFPAMGMMAAAHKPVFALLLSTKWAGSGNLFMLVSAACALQAVTALFGTVLLILGRADIQRRTTLEFGILWVVTLLVAVRFGIEAVAIAYNIIVLLYVPRTLHFVLPLMDCTLTTYLKALCVPTITTIGCVLAYSTLRRIAPMGDAMLLVTGITLMTIGVSAAGLVQRRAILEEITLWRMANRQEGVEPPARNFSGAELN